MPRLLDLLSELGVHGTFFFCHGPDRSGRAIVNVLRQRGFLRKMIRTRALRMYGLRTALSGTLLPSPVIGARLGDVMRRARDEGHDVGLHGWDHRRWQDGLERLHDDEVAAEVSRAVESHARILGEPPRAFAAPGWMIDDRALLELERHDFDWTSSTRFGPPFFPVVDERPARMLEVPSTGPCPEEAMTRGGGEPLFPAALGEAGGGPEARRTHVYPAHAEVEGGILLAPFRSWLRERLAEGIGFVKLRSVVDEALAGDTAIIPRRRIERVTVTGRPALVSSGYPELAGESATPC